MDIEVEVRSFLTQEQYQQLLQFFHKKGELVKEDQQETHYFDCEQDVRIQKNNSYSKVWLKKGKLHDDQREEIEVKCDKDDFEKLERLFSSLGYATNIKWFRTRHEFSWEGVSVMVDYTKGYGYILELEKMATDDTKEEVLRILNEKLEQLNVTKTPKEEFAKKYQYYKENWRSLLN